MLTVHCHICETTYLISTWNILHLANTDAGIITMVKCPNDHLTAINHHARRQQTPALSVSE